MARPVNTFSKDRIKREILKSGKDPIYFVKNYLMIHHPLRGLIPFTLFPFQENILKDFNDYRFNVLLKARQLGVSTLVAAFALHMMLFFRGKSIVVVATKEKKAVNVVKKAKLMYKKMPKWLKITALETDNQNSFSFENGSSFVASATTEDVGRSESLSLLIIDEAAIVRNLEGLWAGLYNTVAMGGKCIMISTPFGAGGLFYRMYTEAEEGKNDFHPSCYDWRVHPERDDEWYRKETKNMSRRDIAQELDCSFLMSGETVFDGEDIARIEKEDIVVPLYKTAFDRNLWIWEEYVSGNTYCLVSDVSRGDSADFSVAHVLKVADVTEIVAEYQGKATPDVFSNFLFNLGTQYGSCLLIVENNSIGFAVLEKLKELKYPNIYYSEKSSHDFVEMYEAENRSGVVAGFTTSTKTRPLVVAKMEEMIRNKTLKFHSQRLLNECKTFVWNGSRPEPQRGYNDDLVMACAIGCYVRDLVFEVNTRELEYKKSFLTSMFRDTTILNTKIPGMMGAPTSLSFQDRMKEYKEYSWIFTDAELRRKKS